MNYTILIHDAKWRPSDLNGEVMQQGRREKGVFQRKTAKDNPVLLKFAAMKVFGLLQLIQAVGKTSEKRLSFFLLFENCGRRLLLHFSDFQVAPPSLIPHVLARAAAKDEMDAPCFAFCVTSETLFSTTAVPESGFKRPRPRSFEYPIRLLRRENIVHYYEVLL
jgi:hypothetical protein